MKRNKFSLSNYKLLSLNMGDLIPCGLQEVLPGDSFQLATQTLLRVSPLLAPVMHPVHVRIHHWFVPHRLVWDDWEDFITGGEDGMDSSMHPYFAYVDSVPVGSLADYYGLPTISSGSLPQVSALPFRGYSLIWNEYYRDQDLQSKLTVDTTDGLDTTTARDIQKVCWEKDYYTTSRPWEDKGPDIGVDVQSNGEDVLFSSSEYTDKILRTDTSGDVVMPVTPTGNVPNQFGSETGLEVDPLAIREAFGLLRYQEARAMYGSRYTEYLRYLGVRSSDARLQRPEYLGGGRQTIQFSEVLQTAEGTDPVGALKGHGISAVRSNRFRKFFEEHGYIHSFISVQPKTMYVQNIPRTFLRQTKEDYHQKELEHIGQQAIKNKEVYGQHSTPDGDFGFQNRYEEYRRALSSVAGDFRDSLDYWHMARIFSGDVTLNSDFVESNPTDRIYASSSDDVLWCMAYHSIQARRALSKFGKPGMKVM
jgi:hypothetical protein